jgi:RNA polymerase sigma-70 factor (ECF subfamily)
VGGLLSVTAPGVDLAEGVSDAMLAVRAAEGDAEAFERLLLRYRGGVYRLAIRMLGDPVEAEDVAQEVFLTAWRHLPELTDPAAVRTWLFRIAHRQCLGLFRTRRSRRTEPTDAFPDSAVIAVGGAAPVGWFDPPRVAEAGAGVRALGVAVAGLSPPQRAVWVLAEVEGLPFAEIAQVVGTTEQAVRGRLSRARARLAEVMRPWR